MFDRVLNKRSFKKLRHPGKGERIHEKSDKNEKGGWGTAKKMLSITLNFFCVYFFADQFLLLCMAVISSDNVTVSNNQKYPKGYLCL